ncbi:hypothetical protein CF327_g1033 [Tilletia walkeri]|nr:hypothetical protein CF327_g1033 [Tilletia walkeri]
MQILNIFLFVALAIRTAFALPVLGGSSALTHEARGDASAPIVGHDVARGLVQGNEPRGRIVNFGGHDYEVWDPSHPPPPSPGPETHDGGNP